MRPRLSPEDQDLGSSATLYCYREQSGGGGGSTEVLPSADVPDGEKPLKAKAHKVGQLNLRKKDVVVKTVNELKTDVRLPDGFTRGNNHVWTTSLEEGPEEAVRDARSEGRRLTVPAGGVVRIVKDHRRPDVSTCICAIRPSRTASSQLMRDLSAAIDEKGENFAKGILCALSENDGTWEDKGRDATRVHCGWAHVMSTIPEEVAQLQGRKRSATRKYASNQIRLPGKEEGFCVPYALQGMETKNYKDNIEPFLLEVGLPAMKLRDELDGGESKKGLDQIYDPHDPEAYGFPVCNDEYRDPKFKQFRRAFSKIAVAIVTDDEDCETEIGRIHIDIKDVKKGFRVKGVGDVQGGSKLQHQISTIVLQMPFGERRQYPPELSCAAESEVGFHYRFGPWNLEPNVVAQVLRGQGVENAVFLYLCRAGRRLGTSDRVWRLQRNFSRADV